MKIERTGLGGRGRETSRTSKKTGLSLRGHGSIATGTILLIFAPALAQSRPQNGNHFNSFSEASTSSITSNLSRRQMTSNTPVPDWKSHRLKGQAWEELRHLAIGQGVRGWYGPVHCNGGVCPSKEQYCKAFFKRDATILGGCCSDSAPCTAVEACQDYIERVNFQVQEEERRIEGVLYCGKDAPFCSFHAIVAGYAENILPAVRCIKKNLDFAGDTTNTNLKDDDADKRYLLNPLYKDYLPADGASSEDLPSTFSTLPQVELDYPTEDVSSGDNEDDDSGPGGPSAMLIGTLIAGAIGLFVLILIAWDRFRRSARDMQILIMREELELRDRAALIAGTQGRRRREENVEPLPLYSPPEPGAMVGSGEPPPAYSKCIRGCRCENCRGGNGGDDGIVGSATTERSREGDDFIADLMRSNNSPMRNEAPTGGSERLNSGPGIYVPPIPSYAAATGSSSENANPATSENPASVTVPEPAAVRTPNGQVDNRHYGRSDSENAR